MSLHRYKHKVSIFLSNTFLYIIRMTILTIIIAIASCLVMYLIMSKINDARSDSEQETPLFEKETIILSSVIVGLLVFVIMANVQSPQNVQAKVDVELFDDALPIEYDNVIDIEEGFNNLPPIFHQIK